MFRSTMNANKTNMFPPTVNNIQSAKAMAINIVCHNSKGGKTGSKIWSSGKDSLLEKQIIIMIIKINVVNLEKKNFFYLLKKNIVR